MFADRRWIRVLSVNKEPILQTHEEVHIKSRTTPSVDFAKSTKTNKRSMSSTKPLREFEHMDWVPIDYGEVFDKRIPFLRDMGTHGFPPTRVLEVPVKWTRPIRSPTDLQVGPETLSTTPTTLEDIGRPHLDHGRPAGLVVQDSPLGRSVTPLVGPRIAGSAL
jgi:hypothetical protein